MVYQGHQAQSAQLQMLEAQNADLRQQVRDAGATTASAGFLRFWMRFKSIFSTVM